MIIQNIITVVEALLIKRGRERLSLQLIFFIPCCFLRWHLYILLYNYSLVNLIAGITVISVVKLVAILLVPAKTGYNNGDYEEVIDGKHFTLHWGYFGN